MLTITLANGKTYPVLQNTAVYPTQKYSHPHSNLR